MYEEHMQHGNSLINSLNYAAEQVDDSAELIQIVQAFGAERDIKTIFVLANSPLRVIASTKNKWLGTAFNKMTPHIQHDITQAISPKNTKTIFHNAVTSTLHLSKPLKLAIKDSYVKLTNGATFISLDNTQLNYTLRNTSHQLIFATLVTSLLLALLIFGVLHITVVSPIRSIVSVINNRTKNIAQKPIPVTSTDEIAQVAIALNDMFYTLGKNKLRIIEEKEKAEEFLEISNAIIIGLDIAGNITLINQVGCNKLGYSQEELLSQNWFNKMLPTDNLKEIQDTFRQAISAQIPDSRFEYIEYAVLTKSSNRIFINWHNIFKYDPEGNIVGLLSAGQDITVRKHMEDLIHDSENRLLISQQIAHVGSWDWDIISGTLTWTDEIFRIFGLQPQQFEANYDAFLKTIHPDDRDNVIIAVNASVENPDIPYKIEHRIIRPDGSERNVEEAGLVYYNEANNPIRMIGSVHDITERKIAEKNLKESQIELENRVNERTADLEKAKLVAENANKSKSKFLSRMSHELRTPLNAILGFTQLLELELENDMLKDYVKEISNGGTLLLELINDILDISRIEAGKLDLSMQAVSISDMVNDCFSLMGPLATQRNIRLTNNIKNNMFLIRVDPIRFKQILLNILGNAIKYNKQKGTVTIKCLQREINGGNWVKIEIQDTGEGIADKDIPLLFTPFERLGNESIEGTGIGLSLTKRLTDLMGGNIGVNSTVGVGSLFWLEFPSTDAVTDQNEHPDKNTNVLISQSSQSKKYVVLYVEDNSANLKLVEHLFEKRQDIIFFSAHMASLGLDLALAHNPDLILLDINLPDFSGFDLLKMLRQTNKLQNTPVVAISVNTLDSDLKNGRDAGFDNYLTKPLNIENFYQIVNDYLPYSDLVQKSGLNAK